MCQEKVPSAGAHSLAQPCPFPHEASRLVEQPDFERAHRERRPVSVLPGALSLAVPCTVVSAGC